MKKVFVIGIGALALAACDTRYDDPYYESEPTLLASEINNFPFVLHEFDNDNRELTYSALSNPGETCTFSGIDASTECKPTVAEVAEVTTASPPKLSISVDNSGVNVFRYDRIEELNTYGAESGQVVRNFYNGDQQTHTITMEIDLPISNHTSLTNQPVGGSWSCSNGETLCTTPYETPSTVYKRQAEIASIDFYGTMTPTYSNSTESILPLCDEACISDQPPRQLLEVPCQKYLCKLDSQTGELWLDERLVTTLTLQFIQGEDYFHINLPENNKTYIEHIAWSGDLKGTEYLQQWTMWPTDTNKYVSRSVRIISQQAFDDMTNELTVR